MHKSSYYLPRLHQQRQEKIKLKYHKRMISRAKPTVNSSAPLERKHLTLKLKKNRIAEERYTEIERENRILLEKLQGIMKRKSRHTKSETSHRKKSSSWIRKYKISPIFEHPNNKILNSKQVFKKGFILNQEFLVVEIQKKTDLFELFIYDAYGPDKYKLEISNEVAEEIAGNPVCYETLVSRIKMQNEKLVLSEEMGCCEVRQEREKLEPSTEKLYLEEEIPSENSVLTELTQSINQSDISNSDLEEYINRLLKDPEWNLHVERKDYAIKTKEKSVFNEEIPVALGVLNFEESLPITELYNLLFDPEIRRKWDPTILDIRVTKYQNGNINNIKIVKKFPFINREMNLKLTHKIEDELTSVIFESAAEESKDKNTVTAECMFGAYKILKKPSGTVFICMEQIDNKQPNHKEKSILAASEMTEWILFLKKAVQVHFS